MRSLYVDLKAAFLTNYPVATREQAQASIKKAKGKPEAFTVQRAACRRFPDLPECKSPVKT